MRGNPVQEYHCTLADAGGAANRIGVVPPTYVLSMTEDYGTQDIELIDQGNTGYQGLHSLFFETTGCAYTGGCFP